MVAASLRCSFARPVCVVFGSLRLPGKRLVCVGSLHALALAARLASCCRSRSASQLSRHVSTGSYTDLRAKLCCSLRILNSVG